MKALLVVTAIIFCTNALWAGSPDTTNNWVFQEKQAGTEDDILFAKEVIGIFSKRGAFHSPVVYSSFSIDEKNWNLGALSKSILAFDGNRLANKVLLVEKTQMKINNITGFYFETQAYDHRELPTHTAFFLYSKGKKKYIVTFQDYQPQFKQEINEIKNMVATFDFKQ